VETKNHSSTEFGTFSQVGSDVTGTSFTHTGLITNSTYYYYVVAFNALGDSPNSTTVSATAAALNPPTTAPSNVNVIRISPTSAFVTWNSVTGATSYNVYWSNTATGSFTLDGNVTGTSFTSLDWSSDFGGFIRVAAVNADGEGPRSASVGFLAFSATTINVGATGTAREFVIEGPVGTVQLYRVNLNEVGPYPIRWIDSDNSSYSGDWTDIEVGLVRESTGLFVQPLADRFDTNTFTHTTTSATTGWYIIVVRKRAQPDATWFDLWVE
jgi:hypothetical protein